LPPATRTAKGTLQEPTDGRRDQKLRPPNPCVQFLLYQRRRLLMARKTVLVSDLSGEEIAEGKGAQVTIKFNDARKGSIVLDVTDQEGEEIGRKGRKQVRRGRRPKTAEPQEGLNR